MTTPTRAGVVLTSTPGDATNNHVMVNDGHTVILIKNTGSTVARTITFRFAKKVDGQAVTSRTASLVTGERRSSVRFPRTSAAAG
ncbi:hypothetical protein [Streptomyces sp. NPDC002825]|uniref:hypothetical protein n=1 Tax=Streptomyces sp. NPDC002825 TaxID=3154666 RepID=UPI00332AA058